MIARSTALLDVARERQKQRRKWSAAHDDEHNDGALAWEAASLSRGEPGAWGLSAKHPGTRERLVIAAALLIAEIERIDRDAARSALRKAGAP